MTVNAEFKFHPIVEQCVGIHTLVRSIIDEDEMTKIATKMTLLANRVLESASTVPQKESATTQFAMLERPYKRDKYTVMIKGIVSSLWGFKLEQTVNISFRRKRDGTTIPIQRDSLRVSWNDSSKTIYKKPVILPFKPSMPKDLLAFEEYRQANLFTDAVIHCGGEKFLVHRIVLSARCSFFKAAFTNPMKEGSTSEITINLEEMHTDLAHFKEFLQFLYTDQVKLEGRSIPDIEKLLTLAAGYRVKGLIEACVYELSKCPEENLQEVSDISSKYSLEPLQQLCEWREKSPLAHLQPLPVPPGSPLDD